MLANALSASVVGVEGLPVRVEVDVSFGLPGLTIVGLAGSAVLEARERVRAALRNSGFEVPARRITVNLAPADLPKEGTGHDLAMAAAILAASDQLEPSALLTTALIGELALDGSLRRVPGVLPILLHARSRDFARAVIPFANLQEARVVEGLEVIACETLRAATAMGLATTNRLSTARELQLFAFQVGLRQCYKTSRSASHARCPNCPRSLSGRLARSSLNTVARG